MKKKMGYLQVILMIGCIPMLATMVALTVYASGKMKDELVDSTYLRLKACATSVEQYFTWDIREDILEKDDISYQFIDSLQDEHIEQTLFMEDDDEEEVYKLVTSIRGSSIHNMISTESPLGRAILRHKVGDRVLVQANETYSYYVTIRKIENTDDSDDTIRKY